MPEPNLEVKGRKVTEEAYILDVEGEITGFGEKRFLDAMADPAARRSAAIILNLSRLECLSGSGIGLLIRLVTVTRKRRQRLMACGVSDHYQRVFKLTRVDAGIEVYSTLDDALLALAGTGRRPSARRDCSEAVRASQEPAPRDAPYWAPLITRLSIADVPAGVIRGNVHGKRVVGPLQGFGQMWRRTYEIMLCDPELTPATVIRTWKERFSDFLPPGNRFHFSPSGIAPGETAIVNVTGLGRLQFCTGVLVIYSDDESFAFMTIAGHMVSGLNSFLAYRGDGYTIARVRVIVRPNDPVWEISMRLFGYKREDAFWRHVLGRVGQHLSVDGVVTSQVEILDDRQQWSQIWNIWHNAAIRSIAYAIIGLVRHRGKAGKC